MLLSQCLEAQHTISSFTTKNKGIVFCSKEEMSDDLTDYSLHADFAEVEGRIDESNRLIGHQKNHSFKGFLLAQFIETKKDINAMH
jgi:hypothetical protein